jgi:hypothetical protein
MKVKFWGVVAIGAAGAFWLMSKRKKGPPMVAVGWGGGATAGLPALTPSATLLGNVEPSVPPPPGAHYQADNSGGNGGSGGW